MKKPSTPKPSANKKASKSLVAVSSAAVLAVYAAGYTRTQAAATKLEGQTEGRRTPPPPVEGRPTLQPEAEPQIVRKTTRKPAEVTLAKAVTPPAPKPTETPAPAEIVSPAPAPAPVAATEIKPAEPKAETKAADAKPNPALPPWKDGTYEGWGSCRHGDLQATVVIEGGRIVSSTISQCLTRYSCDIIDTLLPEPPKKQSPNVSSVSGATQSADAFYYAVYDALAKAK